MVKQKARKELEAKQKARKELEEELVAKLKARKMGGRKKPTEDHQLQ